MSDLDRTIFRALKAAAKHDGTSRSRDKAENSLRTALEEIKSESLASSVSEIHGYLLGRRRLKETGAELNPPLTLLSEMISSDFTKSVELGFLEMLADVSEIPASMVIALAPTPKAIDAWVKRPTKAEEISGRTEELLQSALESPETAIQSGLGLWVVEKIPIQQLLKTLPLFQAARAQKHFPAERRRELLHSALLRDREGTFLLRYLQDVAQTDEDARSLVADIRSSSRVAEKVIENLPQALLGDEAGRLGDLTVSLFGRIREWKEPARYRANGEMVTLFGKLLAEDAGSPGLDVAKAGLADLFREWDTTEAKDSDEIPSSVLWIVREAGKNCSGSEPDAESENSLSIEQAKHIGIALEKSRSERQTLGVVEAMAANLGMDYFGSEDEEAEFDPDLHEDTVGGILPGETVTIIYSGWKLGDEVILRAPVE